MAYQRSLVSLLAMLVLYLRFSLSYRLSSTSFRLQRPSSSCLRPFSIRPHGAKPIFGRGKRHTDLIRMQGLSPLLSDMEKRASFDKTHPRWKKHTKQIATVGPASSSIEMLESLFLAGVDVFRLNFSHGSHEEKAKIVKLIRELEKKFDHPIGILADLQGPKLRIGKFKEGAIVLERGQRFVFDMQVEELGDEQRVSLPHPEIISTLREGDILLLDDGKLRLRVLSSPSSPSSTSSPSPERVECEVLVGGRLSDRKGVNTPSIVLPISPLTAKDRSDLVAALDMNVDWVALSFVQRAEDMHELRGLVGSRASIMAKIEKPAAVQSLSDVVAASDACMVARGDLGVECAPEEVPIIQRKIIDECRRMGRPVVVATQMLESMIEHPVPTRAEASDVATAVFDGADAVMLSAESASGKYPIESVQMQQRVIDRVEESEHYFSMVKSRVSADISRDHLAYDAISQAASSLALEMQAQAVICFTSTGGTVSRASRMRMTVPIVALTPRIRIARRMSLFWGVYPTFMTMEPNDTFDNMLKRACRLAEIQGFVRRSLVPCKEFDRSSTLRPLTPRISS
mmetsp:Transcript_50423/g.157474  ORF Transcript_50423/g.157474 Transcript_50423/m.157474 type:complete len:571 (-) Transcript_50423:385-2097(-)